MICAALATFPARLPTLEKVLARLRPQVDQLCVYLDQYDRVPDVVTATADRWELGTAGDAGKFHWADRWDGYYLTCDDDLLYDPGYVAATKKAIDQWGGRAIVTWHGRTFLGHPTDFLQDAQDGTQHDFCRATGVGAWINWPGTGCLGVDTRIRTLPQSWVRNACDNVLALWAQQFHVPIWWVGRSTIMVDPLNLSPSIWEMAVADGCHQMNLAIQQCPEWKLYHA